MKGGTVLSGVCDGFRGHISSALAAFCPVPFARGIGGLFSGEHRSPKSFAQQVVQ